jgi:hypothetical protein
MSCSYDRAYVVAAQDKGGRFVARPDGCEGFFVKCVVFGATEIMATSEI